MAKAARIIGVLFILFSIFPLGICAYCTMNTKSFLNKAERTHGTVLDVVERRTSDGTMFYPVYSFVDVYGTQHKIYSKSGSYPPRYDVGDLIPILYDPENPKEIKMFEILFNIIAILLIVFIVWWFWLVKSKANEVKKNVIDIIVKNGVYTPNRILAKSDSKIVLNFIRKEQSPCSEFVVFSDLDIHEQLTANKKHPIVLPPLKAGVYKFTCQMGMYQGELIIE